MKSAILLGALLVSSSAVGESSICRNPVRLAEGHYVPVNDKAKECPEQVDITFANQGLVVAKVENLFEATSFRCSRIEPNTCSVSQLVNNSYYVRFDIIPDDRDSFELRKIDNKSTNFQCEYRLVISF